MISLPLKSLWTLCPLWFYLFSIRPEITFIFRRDAEALRFYFSLVLGSEITVTDAELRVLSVKRVSEVKDYLLAGKSVTADRIFLTVPRNLKKQKNSKPHG